MTPENARIIKKETLGRSFVLGRMQLVLNIPAKACKHQGEKLTDFSLLTPSNLLPALLLAELQCKGNQYAVLGDQPLGYRAGRGREKWNYEGVQGMVWREMQIKN